MNDCVQGGIADTLTISERMFSLSFLRVNDFFYNLPLFISEVSWILTHNLN